MSGWSWLKVEIWHCQVSSPDSYSQILSLSNYSFPLIKVKTNKTGFRLRDTRNKGEQGLSRGKDMIKQKYRTTVPSSLYLSILEHCNNQAYTPPPMYTVLSLLFSLLLLGLRDSRALASGIAGTQGAKQCVQLLSLLVSSSILLFKANQI